MKKIKSNTKRQAALTFNFRPPSKPSMFIRKKVCALSNFKCFWAAIVID